jgi:hypothetical protein
MSTEPQQRMVLTHFIVSDDVERSRRFYTEVLGGTVVFGPEPTNIALANGFIIINVGGGPTDDKPTVTLETPRDPDRVSSFLNLRSPTSMPRTLNGAPEERSSLPRRNSTSTRSAATSAIPTATSSRLGKQPTHKETGGQPNGHQSTQAGNPTRRVFSHLPGALGGHSGTLAQPMGLELARARC